MPYIVAIADHFEDLGEAIEQVDHWWGLGYQPEINEVPADSEGAKATRKVDKPELHLV